LAILTGEEIAFEHLDSRPLGPALDDRSDLSQFAGGAGKADQVAKPAIHQTFYHARSYETRGACYQDSIFGRDDDIVTFYAVHTWLLLGDIRFLYWVEA